MHMSNGWLAGRRSSAVFFLSCTHFPYKQPKLQPQLGMSTGTDFPYMPFPYGDLSAERSRRVEGVRNARAVMESSLIDWERWVRNVAQLELLQDRRNNGVI
jgi:hypothetical protein